VTRKLCLCAFFVRRFQHACTCCACKGLQQQLGSGSWLRASQAVLVGAWLHENACAHCMLHAHAAGCWQQQRLGWPWQCQAVPNGCMIAWDCMHTNETHTHTTTHTWVPLHRGLLTPAAGALARLEWPQLLSQGLGSSNGSRCESSTVPSVISFSALDLILETIDQISNGTLPYLCSQNTKPWVTSVQMRP
jgi:hypothetical protein